MFYYKAIMHKKQPEICYIGSCHPFLTDMMLQTINTNIHLFYQQVQTKHPDCTYISNIQLTELSDIISETNLASAKDLETADNFFIL